MTDVVRRLAHTVQTTDHGGRSELLTLKYRRAFSHAAISTNVNVLLSATVVQM